MAKITYGSDEIQIKEASLNDLLDALATPDGCGVKKKLLIIKTLLTFQDVNKEIDIKLN